MSRVCGKYLPSRFRVVMGSHVSISWGRGTCNGRGPGGPGVHRPALGQGPRPMASATICEGVGSITCRMFRFKNNGPVWASRQPAPPDVPWVNWGDGSVHNCCQHLCDKCRFAVMNFKPLSLHHGYETGFLALQVSSPSPRALPRTLRTLALVVGLITWLTFVSCLVLRIVTHSWGCSTFRS